MIARVRGYSMPPSWMLNFPPWALNAATSMVKGDDRDEIWKGVEGVDSDDVPCLISSDGATERQRFLKITVPMIRGSLIMVTITVAIVVLKVFDIVFAMTNGQWETQVLANYMYDKLFRANDWGIGSAAAMIIMLLVTPILVWNVYNARKEMR